MKRKRERKTKPLKEQPEKKKRRLTRYTRITRGMDTRYLEALELSRKSLLAEEKRRQEEQLKKEQEALEKIPKAKKGSRKDGNLYISFVKMGQGDCTLISTPEGKLIMIDCGSDSIGEEKKDDYKRRVHDTIYSGKFLRDIRHIDHLILTHSDTDHHNKLGDAAIFKTDTRAHQLHHSGKLSSYGGSAKTWISKTKPTKTCAVTLNSASTIKKQEIVKEKYCRVSLLASNVTNKNNKEDKNSGSIVTLIEAFGKRILVCGDATTSTEAFLLKNHTNAVKGLDAIQVPHHGSATTSSCDEFVKQVTPKLAIVSAKKKDTSHHLPRKEALNKYRKHAAKIKNKRQIFFWEKKKNGSIRHASEFYEKDIYTTGSNGTIEGNYSNSGRHYGVLP